jgi:multidrug efflux system membrane fusion protein
MIDSSKEILIAALTFCLLPLAGCGKKVEKAAPVIRPVRYQEVIATGGRRDRKFSGTAKAGQESDLSFRVGGSVSSVAVTVGRNVRQGDLIARLDPTDFQLQLQQSEASLAQAKAAGRKAAADYERVRGLYENQNAAKSDLDAARAQSESTEAQALAATQGVARARRQLSYTRLTAPVDGAIAAVRVEENENVQPGQPVALLTSGSRPEVQVSMPGVLISQVVPGSKVDVAFESLPGDILLGVVTEVGVAATGASSTYPVTVRLDKSDDAIRSGMAATVTFRFEPEGDTDRIFVPSVAVGEDRQGRFVYLLEKGQGELATTRRHPVEIGDLTPEGLEVTSGLNDGQLIATAGVRRIQDGQSVRVLASDTGETP